MREKLPAFLQIQLAVDLELGRSDAFLVALEFMVQLEVLAAQLADFGREALARGVVRLVDEFAHVLSRRGCVLQPVSWHAQG